MNPPAIFFLGSLVGCLVTAFFAWRIHSRAMEQAHNDYCDKHAPGFSDGFEDGYAQALEDVKFTGCRIADDEYAALARMAKDKGYSSEEELFAAILEAGLSEATEAATEPCHA